jgi:hypothetical protein
MAYSIETGGFAVPQQAPTAENYSALAALRPLQFGQSPIQIKPLDRWQIPTDGTSKGITEGASGALKTITAAYVENKKEERADAREDKKLTQQLALERSKEDGANRREKARLLAGIAEAQIRASVGHPSKSESIHSFDEEEQNLRLNDAKNALDEAEASGLSDSNPQAFERLFVRHKQLTEASKRVESVVPGGFSGGEIDAGEAAKQALELIDNKSIIPDGSSLMPSGGEPPLPQPSSDSEDGRRSGRTSQPRRTGNPRPGDWITIGEALPQSSKPQATSGALSGVMALAPAPAQAPTAAGVRIGGITVGAQPLAGIPQVYQLPPPAQPGSFVSGPWQSGFDALAGAQPVVQSIDPRGVTVAMPPGLSLPDASQAASAITPSAITRDAKAQKSKSRAEEIPVISRQKTLTARELIEQDPSLTPQAALLKAGKLYQDEEARFAKEQQQLAAPDFSFLGDDSYNDSEPYSQGTPMKYAPFRSLEYAKSYAARRFKGWGPAAITFDKTTGLYAVERNLEDEKVKARERRDRSSSLWSQQKAFNSYTPITTIEKALGPMVGFMAAYESVNDPTNKAKNIADMDLIDQYIKITKGGLVTEAQYAQLAHKESWGAKIEKFFTGKATGAKLTDQERERMLDVVTETYNVSAERANKAIEVKRAQMREEFPSIKEKYLPHAYPLYRTKKQIDAETSALRAKYATISRSVSDLETQLKGDQSEENVHKLKDQIARDKASAKLMLEAAGKLGSEANAVKNNHGLPVAQETEYVGGWVPIYGRGGGSEVVAE